MMDLRLPGSLGVQERKDISTAGDAAAGQAAGQNFGERCEVGRDTGQRLRPPGATRKPVTTSSKISNTPA